MYFDPQVLFNIDPEWISLATIVDGVAIYDTRPLSWFNDEGQPLSKEEIVSLGYYGVINEKITFDPQKEHIYDNPLDIANINEENHTILKTYNIVPISNEEFALIARDARNNLLRDSDTLTFSDRWETYDDKTKEKIRTYRSQLRDLPEQENFPTDIIWPVLSLGDSTPSQQVQMPT